MTNLDVLIIIILFGYGIYYLYLATNAIIKFFKPTINYSNKYYTFYYISFRKYLKIKSKTFGVNVYIKNRSFSEEELHTINRNLIILKNAYEYGFQKEMSGLCRSECYPLIGIEDDAR